MNILKSEIALSLKELLSNHNYIIPIYQRNYSWGKEEISLLIRDIKEFFKSESSNKNYYIGSLICFKRENGDYELIDGQQRHTTISLINVVLKNWDIKLGDTVSSSNLKFDSRKNIQSLLEGLYSTTNFENYLEITKIVGTGNFRDAINFIKEELDKLDEIEIKTFASDFYNKVKFFRVEVPEDTDLNHYFEIMNNRGEQLEKHEIIKANLLAKIENYTDQEQFAIIWDACSDMSNYIWFNFDKEFRENIDNWGNLIPQSYNKIKMKVLQTNINTDNNLSSILKKHSLSSSFTQENLNPGIEKYKSIIDFPNFLLQVLKIKHNSVSLDDKTLLENFEIIKDKECALEFIFNLLKYRILFDKFIIKQDLSISDETKQNWGIRKTNDKFENVINTFDKSDELLNLQTMLYYSNPSKSYNNWLHEVLKHGELNKIEKYTELILKIAKDRFNKVDLSYRSVSTFNLYFIDFLLWKLYNEKIRGNETKFKEGSLEYKIAQNKELFNTFNFKQLNSKEHLFPQASIITINEDVLHSIGNLCLISTSQNSAGNKENPSDKKERFKNDNSSLKRLIMFESFENGIWGEKQIEDHEKEINELINLTN